MLRFRHRVWRTVVAATLIATLITAAGCEFSCKFCPKPKGKLPPETEPCAQIEAEQSAWLCDATDGPPATVIDPPGEPVYISLRECIALAMENHIFEEGIGELDVVRLRPAHCDPNDPTAPLALNVSLTTDIEPDQHQQCRQWLNELVFQVEEAYWRLYRVQAQLAIVDRRIERTERLLAAARERLEEQAGTRQSVVEMELELATLRERRVMLYGGNVSPGGGVLEANRALRELMQLPPESCRFFAPSDAPLDLPPEFCWSLDAWETLEMRPDVNSAREQVVLGQRAIEAAREAMKKAQKESKCEIGCISCEKFTGIFKKATGKQAGKKDNETPEPSEARSQWVEARRQKRVACRALSLAERGGIHALAKSFQQSIELYELIGMRRGRTETAVELVALTEQARAEGTVTIDDVFEAEEKLAEHEMALVDAVCSYAVAIAGYELAQGTLLAARGIEFEDEYCFGWVWLCEGDKVRAVPYCPQEGDIILFTSKAGVVEQIGWEITGASHPHHSGLVVRRTDGSLAILESGGGGDMTATVRSIKWRLMNQTNHNEMPLMWVRRLRVPLSTEESCRLTEYAESQVGVPFCSMFRFKFLLLPNRPVPMTRVGQRDWFCSEMVLQALKAAGIFSEDFNPGQFVPRDFFYDINGVDLSPRWAPPGQWTCDPELPDEDDRPPLAPGVCG
jgi:hypothetical protein